MSENEKQPDYNGLKEIIDTIKEARRKAEENPADKKAVEDFRRPLSYPPYPVRKQKAIRPQDQKRKKEASSRLEYVKKRQKTLGKKIEFYKGAFLEGYRNLAALGLDESTIERLFGLKGQFLLKHIETDEEYQLAYQQAMSDLQSKLSRLMLVRAIGYEYEEEKTIYCKKGAMRKKNKDGEKRAAYNPEKIVRNSKWLEYRKEIFKRHQPGDTQMFIFFMTNKFPGEWKVSRELLTGKAEGYDSRPSQRIRKTIESLGRDVLAENTDRPEAEHPVSDKLAQLPIGSDKDGQK